MTLALIPCVCGGLWSDDDDPSFKAAEWNLKADVAAQSWRPSGSYEPSPLDTKWCSVRRDVAAHPETAMRWLETLVGDRCHKVLSALVANPDIAVSHLLEFTEHDHFEVRYALWSREDLPPETYEHLSMEFA